MAYSGRVDRARRVVLGLGSNLGDRAQNLAIAASALMALDGVVSSARAATYESPPAGGPPQGSYYNSAVLLVTAMRARALLDHALAIERSLGRIRPDPVRWGPRTIDVDVLWVEGEMLEEADLVVPHPRLISRVFALRPLLDVAPDARDPRTGRAYADEPEARAPITTVER